MSVLPADNFPGFPDIKKELGNDETLNAVNRNCDIPLQIERSDRVEMIVVKTEDPLLKGNSSSEHENVELKRVKEEFIDVEAVSPDPIGNPPFAISDYRDGTNISPPLIFPRNFQCSVCQKEFCLKRDRDDHERIHTEGKHIECPVCGQKFGSRGGLYCHMNIHKEKFKCDICGKACSNRFNLSQHQATHTAEEPVIPGLGENTVLFQCNICDKRYKTTVALRCHKNIHSDRFKCDICGKPHYGGTQLRAHRATHTSDPVFRCVFCYRGFMRIGPYRQHEAKCTRAKLQPLSSLPSGVPRLSRDYRDKMVGGTFHQEEEADTAPDLTMSVLGEDNMAEFYPSSNHKPITGSPPADIRKNALSITALEAKLTRMMETVREFRRELDQLKAEQALHLFKFNSVSRCSDRRDG